MNDPLEMNDPLKMIQNPYEVLKVLPSAGDSDIKEAYVQKVKKYPPERFPEEFKEIRQAYETIANPKGRVAYKLFHVEQLDVQALVKGFLSGEERKRIPPKRLMEIILSEYLKPTL